MIRGPTAALAAALAAALLAPAALRAESVPDRFAAAQLQFDYKNFEQAIGLLRDLLYPEVLLASEGDIADAREMLGLAYFYTGDEPRAREEFTALLYLRPKHRLDPFLVPPPAVQFFDSIWQEPAMQERLEQIERERQAAEDAANKKAGQPTVVRRIYLERTVTEKHFWIVFMPFGLGQFQNSDTTLGIVMASTQGLALLANAITWTLRWGLQEEGGGYTDPSIAQGLQIAQYSSLAVFGGLYLWGVVDAWLGFEPRQVEPFQRVREETEGPAQGAPETGPATSLAPSLTPSGAGLQFEFRF
jgi:tetratricopeptide (TPR) repeat protein